MTENEKAVKAIAELMASNGDANEAHICEWLTRLLKSGSVRSFLDLADSNYVWLELAELGKFKTIALEDPYFAQKSLPNFVKLLAGIWKTEKDVQLFDYFRQYLSEVFNPEFDFVANFESCLYSHTQEVMHIIVIATVLTCIMVFHAHFSEDELEKLFEGMDEMEEEVSEALKSEFGQIIQLYDAIEEDFVEESIVPEQPSLATPANRTRGVTSVAEQHIAKKVEEMQKAIDGLEADNASLTEKNSLLATELAAAQKSAEEAETTIKQLRYSRDDLLDKLKNKRFDMINEEIQDKQREIEDLKEAAASERTKYTKRLREAEEAKDQLAMKLHQAENYKAEFEALRRTTAEAQRREVREGPSDEELGKLREQLTKLQHASLEDKQKCLSLEMQVSEVSMQAQRLRLENQDLAYRVKELENDRSLGGSEIYVDDFEAIKEELSAAKHLRKLEGEPEPETANILEAIDRNGEAKITPFEANDLSDVKDKEACPRRVETLLFDYERKCLARVKLILKESGEYKEKLSETLREVEDLRETLEEQEEKINNLETRAVESIVASSKDLKELVSSVRNSERDSSEIAQDLLKNIVRKDVEIARLRHNRKRHQREALELEAGYTERLSTLYGVMEAYISNS